MKEQLIRMVAAAGHEKECNEYLRQLQRHFEAKDAEIEIIEAMPGEVEGFKYATALVAEDLEIPDPTSGVIVQKFPLIREFPTAFTSECEITMRSTDCGDSCSAVHLPSGLKTHITHDRSKHRCRATALAVLYSESEALRNGAPAFLWPYREKPKTLNPCPTCGKPGYAKPQTRVRPGVRGESTFTQRQPTPPFKQRPKTS